MALMYLIASRICVNTMLQDLVLYGEEGFLIYFKSQFKNQILIVDAHFTRLQNLTCIKICNEN